MRKFYAELISREGKEYSRSSLLSIRAAIHRHLTGPSHKRVLNVISGPDFKCANDVLTGKIKTLKKEGLDTSTSHPAIKDSDIKLMYSTGTLSDDNPTSLQMKVYFEFCLHFGRRGREGLRELKKQHFVFKFDDHGNEYCTLSHNSLEKNYQGVSMHELNHDQRMYSTGHEHCPLRSLKKYLNLLHPDQEAFFQRPRVSGFENESIWYSKLPVGVNTIGKFMSMISQNAGLSVIYTNHCVRSTTVTTLRNEGISALDIMSVTGHKCEASINHYSSTSDDKRRAMSLKLSEKSGYSIKKVNPEVKKNDSHKPISNPPVNKMACSIPNYMKPVKKSAPSAALGAPPPLLKMPVKDYVQPVKKPAPSAALGAPPPKCLMSVKEEQLKSPLLTVSRKNNIPKSYHAPLDVSSLGVFELKADFMDSSSEEDIPIPCSQVINQTKNMANTNVNNPFSMTNMIGYKPVFNNCSFNLYQK